MASVGGLAVVAGCSGNSGDGTGGADGDDTDEENDTDGSTTTSNQAETATDTAVGASIEGIESVTVSEGTLIVRRTEGSEVDEVRLFDPNDEQLSGHRGAADFNDVEREVSIPLGTSQEGEYTMVAYTGTNNEVGRETLTLTRSFEVVDATYLSRVDWGPAVAFDVRATGDLPLSVTRIEVLESSGAFGDVDGVIPIRTAREGQEVWAETELDAERISNDDLTVSGGMKWYWMNGGLRLAKERDTTPPDSCGGWTLQRRYELTVTGGESAVVDLNLDFSGSFHGTEGVQSHFVCETGEVTVEEITSEA